MQRTVQAISLSFAAGAAGGLANSLALWAAARFGLVAALGVAISPPLTPMWLYPRIVWGGIWGFLFLLSIPAGSPVMRGLIYSLAPTLMQLLVVFPMQARKGMFGLELGLLTPLVVILANAVWGVAAGWWLGRSGKG